MVSMRDPQTGDFPGHFHENRIEAATQEAPRGWRQASQLTHKSSLKNLAIVIFMHVSIEQKNRNIYTGKLFNEQKPGG
jgi:predicted HAD superfamily Cof-like phosphohydrolase